MMKSDRNALAKSIGHSIAERRKENGFTQDWVAEQMGIGVEAVSRIERGVALPSLIRLARFADIYKCQITDLLAETSQRPSDQVGYIAQQLGRLDEEDRLFTTRLMQAVVSLLVH